MSDDLRTQAELEAEIKLLVEDECGDVVDGHEFTRLHYVNHVVVGRGHPNVPSDWRQVLVLPRTNTDGRVYDAVRVYVVGEDDDEAATVWVVLGDREKEYDGHILITTPEVFWSDREAFNRAFERTGWNIITHERW